MSKTVRLRTPSGKTIDVQPSAVRVYLARGCHVVDSSALDLPSPSARKSEWVAAAADLGVPDPDQLTKDELVDTLTDTEES